VRGFAEDDKRHAVGQRRICRRIVMEMRVAVPPERDDEQIGVFTQPCRFDRLVDKV